MFQAVQNEQHLSIAEIVQQLLLWRLNSVESDAGRLHHRQSDSLRRVGCLQGNKEDAVANKWAGCLLNALPYFQRQARLADAARTDERHQATRRLLQAQLNHHQFPSTADK